MRNYPLSPIAWFAIMVISSLTSSAQTKQLSKAAHATSSDRVPDLSGVWMKDRPATTALQYWVYEFNVEEPPMTAWGQAQYKAAKASFGAHPVSIAQSNDPVYHGCFPPGVPRIFLQPDPVQVVQAPGEVIMLFEYDSTWRQIFTDGRPHDTNLGPSWNGDSIGHWEGDTLIVDTVRFNDKTWLDRVGHPHSDALHLVERIRRINHDHLIDDLTIEDPKAYIKPWTAHLDFLLKPTWTLGDRFCADDVSFLDVEKEETKAGK
jgi:hypothetical protein